MGTVQIAPIVWADRSSLASMLARIEQFRKDEVEVALELIDGAIRDPAGTGYHALVAREGDRVVGYVCFGPTPMTESTWDLYWIATDPDLRGRGIGRALVHALDGVLEARDGRIIRLETSSQESYGGTIRFYQQTGFREGGRIPDFYRDQDDLLIFYRLRGGG